MKAYSGTEEAFSRESVAAVRTALNCAEEQSEHVIAKLRNAGEIDIAITRGGELQVDQNMPVAKWYWKIPETPGTHV